jgi:hypothetical protein
MLPTVVLLLLVCATLIALGHYRWKAETRKLRDALHAASMPTMPQYVDFRELVGLPAPVQRYLRIALTDGMPMVARVSLSHRGSMNMSENVEQWKAFTSDQQVVTRRPGFDWNASFAMLPGVRVRVHDAYVAGQGSLHAALFGLLTVANMQGSEDMAKGELLRFFAEAAWYPTALLPSQGILWQAVDACSARATLVDGAISVSLLFGFHETGVIDTVLADARGRTTGGRIVQTPWQGRFWNYREHAGMHIPFSGEVAWLLPEGSKPYWRGDITSIAHA